MKYSNRGKVFRWDIIRIALGQFNSAIKRSLEPTFLLHFKRLILFHSLLGIWAACLKCFYGNRYWTGQGDVSIITAGGKRLRLIPMARIPSSLVRAPLETEICSLCSSKVGCDSPQPFSQKRLRSSALKPLASLYIYSEPINYCFSLLQCCRVHFFISWRGIANYFN